MDKYKIVFYTGIKPFVPIPLLGIPLKCVVKPIPMPRPTLSFQKRQVRDPSTIT